VANFPTQIHLMGAPGAGVTTLGRALADRLGYRHFDADDYHWFTSDPEPYRRRRNPEHRRQLLRADLDAAVGGWVLSGSVLGWGDEFVSRFQTVVYCWQPSAVRLERIRSRELVRYGAARLAPGGDLNGVFEKFLQWAAEYDTLPEPGTNPRLRSRVAELAWLATLACPVWKLEAELPIPEAVAQLLGWLER
jgi:adenylate kinase family enzyme